jgi:hypothetical protein
MQKVSQISVIRLSAVALLATAFVGCTASNPTIDTSPEAELSFDGLYPVEGGRMDEAWARSDLSVEHYSKIKLQSIGVQYRPDGETRRSMFTTSGISHYEVTPEQKQRFQALMREVFVEELMKGEQYEIVNESGPDVLLVRVGMLDVVSYVPPEPIGNVDIYLSRVGEATLVLELLDSVTDTVLVRAVDRRAAEDSSGGGFSRSNSVNSKFEVHRLAQRWATALREGLDRFLAPGDAAGE